MIELFLFLLRELGAARFEPLRDLVRKYRLDRLKFLVQELLDFGIHGEFVGGRYVFEGGLDARCEETISSEVNRGRSVDPSDCPALGVICRADIKCVYREEWNRRSVRRPQMGMIFCEIIFHVDDRLHNA